MKTDTLIRQPGWRSRLEAVIDEVKEKPFSWEDNECVIGLAARAVYAITLVDMGAQFRGTFNSPESAYRVMKKAGADNLADLAGKYLEEYEGGVSQAKIGDIVAVPVDTKFKFGLGVVNGERFFVLMENGIGTMDLSAATRAFKVG